MGYLASVGGAIAFPLPVEDFFRCPAVNRMALQIRAEPTRSAVVEEALRLSEPLALVPGQALVRQLGV